MANQHYEFVINYIEDEDGILTAEVPDIPGCIASGATLEEARAAIQEAIIACLQVRKKNNMPLVSWKNQHRSSANLFSVVADA